MASWASVFFCMFILVSQVTASPAPNPAVYIGYCVSDPVQSVIYFSDNDLSALATAPGNKAVASVEGPVKKAFEEFLKQKCSFNGNGSSVCSFEQASRTSPANVIAEANRKRALFKSQKKKIIDTGWKFK
jgi:hypothetical protein